MSIEATVDADMVLLIQIVWHFNHTTSDFADTLRDSSAKITDWQYDG